MKKKSFAGESKGAVGVSTSGNGWMGGWKDRGIDGRVGVGDRMSGVLVCRGPPVCSDGEQGSAHQHLLQGYLILPPPPLPLVSLSISLGWGGIGTGKAFWNTPIPRHLLLLLGGGQGHLISPCPHPCTVPGTQRRALSQWVEWVNDGTLTPRTWAPPEKPGSGRSGDASQPGTWGLNATSAVQ